ncbi:MAG: protein kinase domain-containing protein, partial [Gemmataceae bacterium]
GFALREGEATTGAREIVGGAGLTVGTMDYISPEQSVNATAIGPASDQYALGGVLYYALAGCPPFPGGTATQKIRWHRTDDPPSIRTLNTAVPAEFEQILLRMLAKAPADRFATLADVQKALESWATAAEPVSSRTIPTAILQDVTQEDDWNAETNDDEVTEEESSERVTLVERLPHELRLSTRQTMVFVMAVLGILMLAWLLGFIVRRVLD